MSFNSFVPNESEDEKQPLLGSRNNPHILSSDDDGDKDENDSGRSPLGIRSRQSVGSRNKDYGGVYSAIPGNNIDNDNGSFTTYGEEQTLDSRMEMQDEYDIRRVDSSSDLRHPDASQRRNSNRRIKRIMAHLKNFKIHPIASQLIVYSLLPLLIWLVVLLFVGKNNLPGETIFVIVLLECGGRVLGYLVSLLQMPPMVGMLGLGLAVRNIPFFDLMQHWEPLVSAPIRQFALAVILTRAGFGLDLNTLVKFKWLVLRLAVLPTVVESLCVAILAHFLLDFPWMWGILVGFVVAAVSPAVIVPRILHLKSLGYGEKKGVPTVLLASASLDNVVAISLFGVALGFVFASNKGIAEMVLQCPIEVVSGIGFGFAWGLLNGFIFNPAENIESPNADESMVKGMFVLGGGIVAIFGFKLVNYSGAGALGCIFAAFVTSCVWKKRNFPQSEINQIKWGFTFLWQFSEPLLFGVIGCQIVIKDLDGHTVLMSVICLVIGAIVRFGVTYGTASYAGLNTKEKLFIAISWIPKATVQAAIGPIALDYARSSKSPDSAALELLASQVLTIAVVVILLTAPIGEFAVIFSGPRLLTKDTTINIGNGNTSITLEHTGPSNDDNWTKRHMSHVAP